MTEKPHYTKLNTPINHRPQPSNQRFLLMNKSLNGDTLNRNILVTPDKHQEARYLHSPSKYDSIRNYSSLNRNFSLEKNVRPLQ